MIVSARVAKILFYYTLFYTYTSNSLNFSDSPPPPRLISQAFKVCLSIITVIR